MFYFRSGTKRKILQDSVETKTGNREKQETKTKEIIKERRKALTETIYLQGGFYTIEIVTYIQRAENLASIWLLAKLSRQFASHRLSLLSSLQMSPN
jgi:hypothetical protein